MTIQPNKLQWKIDRSQHLEYEENNRISLRKANFAFMIKNPSPDCSYVLNFWSKLSVVVLIKKKRVAG